MSGINDKITITRRELLELFKDSSRAAEWAEMASLGMNGRVGDDSVKEAVGSTAFYARRVHAAISQWSQRDK